MKAIVVTDQAAGTARDDAARAARAAGSDKRRGNSTLVEDTLKPAVIVNLPQQGSAIGRAVARYAL